VEQEQPRRPQTRAEGGGFGHAENILIGLYGSAFSTSAVELGFQWARQFNAFLIGLGVVDDTSTPDTINPNASRKLHGHYELRQPSGLSSRRYKSGLRLGRRTRARLVGSAFGNVRPELRVCSAMSPRAVLKSSDK
jgi:hypothetical protein